MKPKKRLTVNKQVPSKLVTEVNFVSLNTRDNIFKTLQEPDLTKILTNKRKKTVPKNPLLSEQKPKCSPPEEE